MTLDANARCLAVIPARGGSKGVPRKNVMDLAGKPLIAWSILAVAEAEEPIRCLVSTDDQEIADVAKAYGAEVVRRPSELASDEAPTEPSLVHVLDILEADGYEPSEVMLLQATSPVRLPGTLDAALRMYHDSGATSLVAVVEEHPFLWRGPVAEPAPLYDVSARPRRQDLTDAQRCYRETGSLYITAPAALRSSGNRISGSTVLFPLRPEEGGDIDTLQDMTSAGFLLSGGNDAARS